MKFNFPFAPEEASTLAAQHDMVFYTITALTVFFTLAVALVVLVLVVRYRHGNKVDRSNLVHHSDKLEIAWSLPPLFLGLVVFFFGAQLYVAERVPPKNCYEVFVIGKQWMWHIQHPNGIRENNTLHIPVGKPVKLTMISQDVIHAFYIPEFRTQFYVVPGRYTQEWFQATQPGTYHMLCNLYCGTQHSEMGGTVVAMAPQDFAKWLQNGGDDGMPQTLEARGAEIFSRNACDNCHTGVSTERGPTLLGVAGSTQVLEDGTKAVADQNYLREAILHPSSKLVKGYPYGTMPEYAQQISEDDTLALIAYLKSISSITAQSQGQNVAAVQSGIVPAAPMVTKPRMADGALATEHFAKTSTVQEGNLAVGALATEKGDEYKK